MLQSDDAVRLAQGEVLEKTLATSRQILANNSVVFGEDGQPKVARVDGECEPGAYFVYLPIVDEKYLFVVVIRPDNTGCLGVSWTFVEAGVRVSLDIRSTQVPPEDITARLGLVPTRTQRMGDIVRGRRTARLHLWSLEPQGEIPGSVEEKLAFLLQLIAPVADAISLLSPVCEVEVSVCYTDWGGDPQFGGFHLSLETVQSLAVLHAAIDFDLYASGPEMGEA